MRGDYRGTLVPASEIRGYVNSLLFEFVSLVHGTVAR